LKTITGSLTSVSGSSIKKIFKMLNKIKPYITKQTATLIFRDCLDSESCKSALLTMFTNKRTNSKKRTHDEKILKGEKPECNAHWAKFYEGNSGENLYISNDDITKEMWDEINRIIEDDLRSKTIENKFESKEEKHEKPVVPTSVFAYQNGEIPAEPIDSPLLNARYLKKLGNNLDMFQLSEFSLYDSLLEDSYTIVQRDILVLLKEGKIFKRGVKERVSSNVYNDFDSAEVAFNQVLSTLPNGFSEFKNGTFI